MRILIIDDDDVARELLSGTLKQSGHHVFELATAIGATRSIFEHDIEAVVVDVNLPDISGADRSRNCGPWPWSPRPTPCCPSRTSVCG
jgi:DNA-binding response OmpR family regulator